MEVVILYHTIIIIHGNYVCNAFASCLCLFNAYIEHLWCITYGYVYNAFTPSFISTAPARPEAIKVSKETNSSFEITWNQKGLFDNFTIEHLKDNNNTSLLTFHCNNSSKCSAVVGDLPIPGDKYNVSLVAVVNLNDDKKLFSLPQNFLAVTG